MKTYLTIAASVFLLHSCSQNPSETEKEYIKNLEEKNRILESELNEMKDHSAPNDSNSDNKKEPATAKDYFTIGSTEDEVLKIMGDPTSYHKFGGSGKTFYYGGSYVRFKDGKVESYSNLDENLKVRVK